MKKILLILLLITVALILSVWTALGCDRSSSNLDFAAEIKAGVAGDFDPLAEVLDP
jgi:hypothetical protein